MTETGPAYWKTNERNEKQRFHVFFGLRVSQVLYMMVPRRFITVTKMLTSFPCILIGSMLYSVCMLCVKRIFVSSRTSARLLRTPRIILSIERRGLTMSDHLRRSLSADDIALQTADDSPTSPPSGNSPIPTGNPNYRPVAPHSVVPPSPGGFGRYVMRFFFHAHEHTHACFSSELTNVLFSTPRSRRFSVETVCPNCHQLTKTRCEKLTTVFTLAIMIGLSLVAPGWWWVPLLLPDLESTEHYCGQCNYRIVNKTYPWSKWRA